MAKQTSETRILPPLGGLRGSFPPSGGLRGFKRGLGLSLLFLLICLSLSSQPLTWQKTPVDNKIQAKTGIGYMLMTNSRPASVLLPSNPSPGNMVGFLDIAGTFPFNGLTVDPGSLFIDGKQGPQSFSVPHLSLTLVYTGSPYGWKTLNTSDVLTLGKDNGQLLYWDNDSEKWKTSDSQQLSYDVSNNQLNVHNLISAPVTNLVGDFNTTPSAWGNQYIIFSTDYGDITSLMENGLQVTLHDGNAEGETVYISHMVSTPLFYEGSTVIGVSPSYVHTDFTSVTIQNITVSPLKVAGNLNVSGAVSGKYSVVNKDTIAIGSIDKIGDMDTNSLFIGSADVGIKLDKSVYVGLNKSNISDTINLSSSVAMGYNVAENSISPIFLSVLIGNSVGYNIGTGYSILLGYRAGFYLRGLSSDNSYYLIGIGAEALQYAHADYTTALGYRAGQYSNTKYSIFLGEKAGYYEDSSYRFVVKQNYINPTPLLYGDFLNGRLSVNIDSVSAYNLDVGGSGHFSTTLSIDSVLMLKPLSFVPASPVNGTLYFSSADNKLHLYSNGAWYSINMTAD